MGGGEGAKAKPNGGPVPTSLAPPFMGAHRQGQEGVVSVPWKS